MKKEDTLDLVLKHKWFDMIALGIKNEEYREDNEYWNKRLDGKEYKYIRFHRGYTSTTITRTLVKKRKGLGKKDWGAPSHPVHILELGQVVGCSA